MTIGTLPNGSRGLDANRALSASDAAAFAAKGFTFVVRYVRRSQAHSYDLTATETAAILGAGLGLMVVQHVAPEGWTPCGDDGALYGNTAAREALAAGYRSGTTLWCDLEGVAASTPPGDVIDFCNEWYEAAKAMGFVPGLYVGDCCGLTAGLLYHALKFSLFWSAYNLNHDQYPAVRGVAMKQAAAAREDFLSGFTNQNMDVDVISADALGGTPALVLP